MVKGYKKWGIISVRNSNDSNDGRIVILSLSRSKIKAFEYGVPTTMRELDQKTSPDSSIKDIRIANKIGDKDAVLDFSWEIFNTSFRFMTEKEVREFKVK